MPYLFPTEDETRIDMNFADGQPPLTVDALDVDNIILEIRSKEIPANSTFEKEFATLFLKRHKRRISRTGVSYLCQIKRQIFEQVKKNFFQLPEQSDTTEQAADSPIANSSSSPSSRTRSRQKKNSKPTDSTAQSPQTQPTRSSSEPPATSS